jgi:choline dehydrogenase-like flavoprotein
MFATPDEQSRILKSIQAELDNVTPYQRKQYERIIAHLESDISANLQLVLVPATFGMAEGIEDQSKVFPPPGQDTNPGISGAMCLQYPVSRGSVHIKSADPFDKPDVDPAFLKHQADVDVLAAGLKMLGKVEQSSHLAPKITSRVFPPPEVDMDDTEALRKCIREICMSEYHVCGSVAMGDAVDGKLKLKGTQNVRVIDASVFPNHVSGNIVSSVYALAEKGADLIKEDYLYGALQNGAKANGA